MHQDLIRAKTVLPLDFEWLKGAEHRLNPQFGTVRQMKIRIRLLAQFESGHSTFGTTINNFR